MFKCWYMDPNKRPTFSELITLMSQNLASLAGYLDVCTFTELEARAREDHDGDTELEACAREDPDGYIEVKEDKM